MQHLFRLNWHEAVRLPKKYFKYPAAQELFQEYVQKIDHFGGAQAQGALRTGVAREAHSRVWVCDRGPGAKVLSSEELAQQLARARDGGVRSLYVVIGGADGFAPDELKGLQPDVRWSFGALTLPHELAAVVAAEQIYRAWTILLKLPYHSGH